MVGRDVGERGQLLGTGILRIHMHAWSCMLPFPNNSPRYPGRILPKLHCFRLAFVTYVHTHMHTHTHMYLDIENTHIRKHTYTCITFHYTMHAALHRIELSTTTCHYNPLHWHYVTLCDIASLYIYTTLPHVALHTYIHTQRSTGNFCCTLALYSIHAKSCKVPVAKLPTGATSCNIGTPFMCAPFLESLKVQPWFAAGKSLSLLLVLGLWLCRGFATLNKSPLQVSQNCNWLCLVLMDRIEGTVLRGSRHEPSQICLSCLALSTVSAALLQVTFVSNEQHWACATQNSLPVFANSQDWSVNPAPNTSIQSNNIKLPCVLNIRVGLPRRDAQNSWCMLTWSPPSLANVPAHQSLHLQAPNP